MSDFFKEINTIIVLFLSIIYTISLFIIKKNRQSKIDGVEKLSKDIQKLHEEKISEQKRDVREKSDILFAGFHKIFCDEFQLQPDAKEAIYFKNLILNAVRQRTDAMMNEVIYINNIAKREGRNWTDYKKLKATVILENIIEFIDLIYKDSLIGIPHKESMTRCRPKIIDFYFSQIDAMLEDIKNISIEYEEKIKEQERVLTGLKNNGKNKNKINILS